MDWEDILVIMSLVAGFAVVCCIVLFMLAIPINYADFITQQTAIEQLRKDSKKVDINSNEDVMGQVTQYNQDIKANQRWNTIPIICLTVPNGWDTIELIEIE